MTERPLIGIVLDEVLDPPADGSAFSRRPFYALRMDYFRAVARAGGAPVGVPYEEDALDAYLARCDGWLIPGGDYRFPPDWYDKPPPPGSAAPSERRVFEIKAATRILDADAPLLGICNGMQVMAAARGGRIAYWGHVARPGGAILHGDPATGVAYHDVTIDPDCKLAAILDAGVHRVNSAHKEDVARVGDGTRITARAPDGVIEAIEFPGAAFAIGVQWHPERDDPAGAALFEALVAAAGGRG